MPVNPSPSTPAGPSPVPISLFAAAVLFQLRKPVTKDNVAKMTAWWQWESGSGNAATFNPADIIMGALSNKPDPPGTTPFNSFGNNLHVANYPDLASGVLQTASYIQANPKLANAFNDGVSYQDGLGQITSFMSGWASPQFMQNIQNTPQDKALEYGRTAISHGKIFDVTQVNQLMADFGGAGDWFFPFYMDTLGTKDPNLGTGPLGPTAADAGVPGIPNFSDVTGFLKAAWTALSTGAFWKRLLYVLGGLVLIFMGLAVLAGHLQGKGDLPKVVPV